MIKESTAVLPEKNNNSMEAEKALFLEYSRIISKDQKSAEETAQLYNDIFYEKKIDKEVITQTMLGKSADFLSEANSKLEQSATDEEKEGIIKQFVEEFREREKIKNKSLKEFKKIAEELNNQYKKVWNINVLKEMDKLRGSNDIKFEDTESFNKAAKGGYKPWWLIYEEQKDKYDSNRVRKLLNGYTELTAQEEDNKDYKNIVIQLEKLIQYQVNLEKKLEQIVFTRESAELPKDFKNKIIEDISLTPIFRQYAKI